MDGPTRTLPRRSTLAGMLVTAVLALPGVAAAGGQPALLCNGLEATVVGTEGDDVLDIRDGDVVVALGGDDEINDFVTDATVCAGPGDDSITVYRDAWLSGDAGHDALAVQTGVNTMLGGVGDDLLVGGYGLDTLVGGQGDDHLSAGDDQLDETFDGGPGLDQVAYRSSDAMVVRLDRGRAKGSGTDRLENIEDAVGSSHGDLLVGDLGANRLDGGPGNDVVRGRAGADTIIGGSGNDSGDGGVGPDTCATVETPVSCRLVAQ